MSFTIFTTCKPFRGQFRDIQWNAIESWHRLEPRPEIIVFGDEEGTHEIVQQLGLRHIKTIDRNEFGTPLVAPMFERAQSLAKHDLICYINADIIVLGAFAREVERMAQLAGDRAFLGVAQKVSVPLSGRIRFDEATWEKSVVELARSSGRYVTPDSDFYVFRRGFFQRIPEFAIGRCFWSSWFMFHARQRDALLIDATKRILAVEPRHDYSHARSTGGAPRLSGIEYRTNKRLFRGCKYFTTADATHELGRDGLEPTGLGRRIRSIRVRTGYYFYFLFKATWYPYSLPLIWVARALRTIVRFLGAPFRSHPHVDDRHDPSLHR